MNSIKLAKIAGLPYKYRIKKSIPEPQTIHFKIGSTMKRISVEEQKEWIKKLLEEPLDYPFIVGISSYPTDESAMIAASNLLLTNIQKDNHFSGTCVNSSVWEWKKIKEKFVIIHNITESATQPRLQVIRDMLTSLDESFVVVVVATNNIVTFFRERLHHPLDCALSFSKGRQI